MRERVGEMLHAAATRNGAKGFTFDDLARAGRVAQGTFGEVVDWLADARSAGFVADLGFDRAPDGSLGPRRYVAAAARADDGEAALANESAPPA